MPLNVVLLFRGKRNGGGGEGGGQTFYVVLRSQFNCRKCGAMFDTEYFISERAATGNVEGGGGGAFEFVCDAAVAICSKRSFDVLSQSNLFYREKRLEGGASSSFCFRHSILL